MRTYYVFNINNYFSYVYKRKPYKLYKLLEIMEVSKTNDIVLSYRYFEQIALTFNKNDFNNYLGELLKNNDNYHYLNNAHIICNNNEYTKIVVKNSHIKIKSNINYPSVFDIIRTNNMSLFICDFNNKDYFWLCNIKKTNCQDNKYLVK